MILHRWIFQQTSPKDKSHIPTHVLERQHRSLSCYILCVTTFFSVVLIICFRFPFPFRIQIQSKHSGWSPCPSFLTSEIFVLLHPVGSLEETRPAGLQRSAHSGFAWVICDEHLGCFWFEAIGCYEYPCISFCLRACFLFLLGKCHGVGRLVHMLGMFIFKNLHTFLLCIHHFTSPNCLTMRANTWCGWSC